MIDAQYALLQAEQTLYASLQAQRTAMGSTNPNVSNVNSSGEAGGEGYAVVTVTEQLSRSAARLNELNDGLLELFRTRNNRFPWVDFPRRRHYGWC